MVVRGHDAARVVDSGRAMNLIREEIFQRNDADRGGGAGSEHHVVPPRRDRMWRATDRPAKARGARWAPRHLRPSGAGAARWAELRGRGRSLVASSGPVGGLTRVTAARAGTRQMAERLSWAVAAAAMALAQPSPRFALGPRGLAEGRSEVRAEVGAQGSRLDENRCHLAGKEVL